MKNTIDSIYYSRTETEHNIVIVWKPFSTYSTYVLLALAIVGCLVSITALSLFAFLLLGVNLVLYSSVCKMPRKEIYEASRKSSVQVSGSKFSFSTPLTITISKNGQYGEVFPENSNARKKGSTVGRIFLCFLTTVFRVLGALVCSALITGVYQGAYIGSLVVLLILTLIFFGVAFLCFRRLKK